MAGEVIWVRELGLRLGDTVLSASVLIAVFFLFAGLGAWTGGRASVNSTRPLRRFALNEIALGLSALACFFSRNAWGDALLPLSNPLTAKIIYAVALAGLPSFFSGYGFPFLSAFVVHAEKERVTRAGLFYTLSLLGAALGVLAGGLVLPMHFGYAITFASVFVAEVVTGICLFLACYKTDPLPSSAPSALLPEEPEESTLVTGWALAWMSGVLSMILESSVFQYGRLLFDGSVYAVSFILACFILGLGVGGGCTVLLRRRIALRPLLLSSLFVLGLFCVAYPYGLQALLKQETWFLLKESGMTLGFLKIFLLWFPLVVLTGAVFPLAWELTPKKQGHGLAIGRLLALNKLACALGMWLVPFFIMPWLGIYGGFVLAGAAYLLLALYFTFALQVKRPTLYLLTTAALVMLALGFFGLQAKPVLLSDGETLVDYQTDAFGLTTVIEDTNGSRHLVRNNTYVLNGTRQALLSQKQEAWLPLTLCNNPKRVLFIGMASGISANAVLDFAVDKLIAAELVPAVAKAAKTHFQPWNERLFSDPRAEIAIDDGRSVMKRQTEPLDAIICDLFLPHRDGVASLYSTNFFESALSHLTPEGVFCLWLPVYQMDEQIGGTIFRTFKEVFPYAIVIRGNMDPGQPAIALIGSAAKLDWSGASLSRRLAELHKSGDWVNECPYLQSVDSFRLCFMGDLHATPPLFTEYPQNTDDFPVIAFEAPRRYWNGASIRGLRLLDWLGTRLLSKNFPSCIYSEEDIQRMVNGLRAGNYYYAHKVVSVQISQDPEVQMKRFNQARQYRTTADSLSPKTSTFSP